MHMSLYMNTPSSCGISVILVLNCASATPLSLNLTYQMQAKPQPWISILYSADQEMGQPQTRVKHNCNPTSAHTVFQKIRPIDSMATLNDTGCLKGKPQIEFLRSASLRAQTGILLAFTKPILSNTLCSMHHTMQNYVWGCQVYVHLKINSKSSWKQRVCCMIRFHGFARI
jgi:hypothetical protein